MKKLAEQNLVTTIEGHVHDKKLKSPVVVQSLDASFELEAINQSSVFIPKYRRDCPNTPLSDLDGFMGVLKFQDQVVPVFDLFARRPKLNNKVLLADIAEFVVWQQFSPIDKTEEEPHRLGALLVNVSDLNKDDTRRQNILRENPEWLREQGDPEKYLRARVVVNAFEKFKVKVKDPTAGISIDVAADNN